MPSQVYTLDQVRILRAFDATSHFLVGSLLSLAFARLRGFADGLSTPLYIVFLWGACVCALRIPARCLPTPCGQKLLWRVRLSSLMAAGLAPFMGWWLRRPDHGYFVAGCAVGAVSVVLFLLALCGLLGEYLKHQRSVRAEVTAVKSMLVYLTLVPLLSLYTTFVIGLIFVKGIDMTDLIRLLFVIPMPARVAITFPPVLAVMLIWSRRRRMLDAQPAALPDLPGPFMHTNQQTEE